jgi:hypothetical protein
VDGAIPIRSVRLRGGPAAHENRGGGPRRPEQRRTARSEPGCHVGTRLGGGSAGAVGLSYGGDIPDVGGRRFDHRDRGLHDADRLPSGGRLRRPGRCRDLCVARRGRRAIETRFDRDHGPVDDRGDLRPRGLHRLRDPEVAGIPFPEPSLSGPVLRPDRRGLRRAAHPGGGVAGDPRLPRWARRSTPVFQADRWCHPRARRADPW